MIPTDIQIKVFLAENGYVVAAIIGFIFGLLLKGQNPIEIYKRFKGIKNEIIAKQ